MNQPRRPHNNNNNNNNNNNKRRGPHDQHRGGRPPHQRGGRDFHGSKQQQGGGHHGQHHRRPPQQQNNARRFEEPVLLKLPIRKFAVVFYDTFAQAKADSENLQAKAKECDQLNIVIKAEGDQNDPDLSKIGKVFAGEAWHLIHTRRVEEGWYNEPR